MLSPMAPHLSHELWEALGYGTMLAREPWPEPDPDLVREETATMVLQVNGKVRDRVEVPAGVSPEEAERLALASEKVQAWIDGHVVVQVVARPPRLVNVVAR